MEDFPDEASEADVELELEVDAVMVDVEEELEVAELVLAADVGVLDTAVDSGLSFARATLTSKVFLTVTFKYAQPGTAVNSEIGFGNLSRT